MSRCQSCEFADRAYLNVREPTCTCQRKCEGRHLNHKRQNCQCSGGRIGACRLSELEDTLAFVSFLLEDGLTSSIHNEPVVGLRIATTSVTPYKSTTDIANAPIVPTTKLVIMARGTVTSGW